MGGVGDDRSSYCSGGGCGTGTGRGDDGSVCPITALGLLQFSAWPSRLQQLKVRAIDILDLLLNCDKMIFGIAAIDCDSSIPAINITVALPVGAANFTSIQGAVNYVPENNNQWFRILVQAGDYSEQVAVNRSCIILEGDSHGGTTIKFNAHDTPLDSPTFYLTQEAENFVAKYINFKNIFNYAKYRFDGYNRMMNGKRGMNDPEIKPAVAALVMGDKASFYYCNFYGVQDTLWDQQGRHFYQNCRIEGLCDFIWGNAQSYYEISHNCHLVSQGAGYITAQGMETEDQPTGFVFNGGIVSGIGPTYLGRAYRGHSRVIFNGTSFDSNVINPLGWSSWDYTGHEANFTYVEASCDARLNKQGKEMEKILDSTEIKKFITYSFINDPEQWINNNNLPY
ncbi:probable pectinesterase 55 [Papaver somniferum]|uniref:probable pectinesterase 55 n=1 Tax=Papaver somniferum TaxID=3469 RepID=UPI000E7033C5|nr:probable pectinesterase 55 [Papaver somniferum]